MQFLRDLNGAALSQMESAMYRTFRTLRSVAYALQYTIAQTQK